MKDTTAATMYGSKQRKLPSPPTSSKTSPKSGRSQWRTPTLSRTASQEKIAYVSGIPKASNLTSSETNGLRNSTSTAKAQKPGKSRPPLVKSRSREFIDAVKMFEGGKLPEHILKSVDEENQMREEKRIGDCEQELWKIRRSLEQTEEDYKTMRLATERIKFHLSEMHSLKTIMSLSTRRYKPT